jgi:cytochrome P450
MMHTDAPEHTRYRALVQPGFTGSRIRSLEPRVRARARELVAAIEPGEAIDLVETVSVPYPLMIIAELLGIPDDDWPRFYEWSEASIPGATDWTEDRRQRLMTEMHEYLLGATRDRRDHLRDDPREDIVSVLANVEVDGEQLSDLELVMFLHQLLVAGNETTRNTISGGLWALATNPDQTARLVGDRALLEPAVEEMLRWTTPVVAFMRTATHDVELRGREIRAGDPLLMVYASANRDEDEFGPTSGAFRVDRSPNHHVAFGFGPHFCIGAALARLEIRVLLEELLARFSVIEPAGEVERTSSSIIAGITRAPLVFR